MSRLNDSNFGSRDYDPSRPENVSRLNDSNFGSNTNNLSSKEREEMVRARNARIKQERRVAGDVLLSGRASEKISEILKQGGSVGRRLEREIRRFQQTGRVSSWLAGETLKAESAQNAAQQSAFRQQVVDVITTSLPSIQIGQSNSYIPPLSLKPIIEAEGGVSAAAAHPWDIIPAIDQSSDPESPNYILRVRAGTIAGILPENWDDEFYCNRDTLYYGIVTCTTDGRNVTSATIDIRTTPPAMQETLEFSVDSPVEFLFGLFENQPFRTTSEGNISAYPTLQIITSKDPPADAGESPFILWYRLA